MEALHTMITKEGTAGTATGVPGADTHYESVSKETDHVNKNKEGHPENNPQEFKQEKAKEDPTKPKTAETLKEEIKEEKKETAKEQAKEELKGKEEKKAEEKMQQLPDTKSPVAAKEEAHSKTEQHEVKKIASEGSPNEKLAALGNQLLSVINDMNKQATAGTATGVPGADTHYESVSKETDHVDKNKEGHPENNPQEFKQEKAKKDPTKPHEAKTAEDLELDKYASFELGRSFARSFLANKTAVDSNIYKEAGRRDFETLIATASAELENEEKSKHKKKEMNALGVQETVCKKAEVEDEMQVKQAEEAGAQAFHALLKQAQDEEQANQVKLAFEQQINEALTAKVAAETKAAGLEAKLAAQEMAIEKKAEEDKLDAKFASWGGRVVEEVISRLKTESARS